eukprot:TRINITY_DN326_c0_g1_i7.p1 TRINITY_DN326_c0_g1~~TRINITY_DN326_c0_g1_i7.p1  ORF type:complete len:854 (-),score=231.04 TRINITY_DN326_c0_g1_i7:236-2797(-)
MADQIFNNITQILLEAQHQDLKIRQEAEVKLQTAERTELPRFLFVLASEVANNAKDTEARSLAGLILKNALSSKDLSRQTALTNQWLQLDPNLRNQIKHLCLTTLATESRAVRNTAAQVVSKVALIEIPVKQWPELIPLLLANVASTDNNLKQSTLETLGFICEDIDEKSLAEQSNQILTAVVHGMNKANPDEVKIAAASALSNALGFAKANFENETERNYLMQIILESTVSTHPIVRKTAFECLVKIGALYYEKLPVYMQDIFKVSLEVIRTDQEQVALQAIEFWSTVCEEEIDLIDEIEEALSLNTQPEHTCHYFIKGALKFLVPVLTEALTKQDEDAEDDDWNLPVAAGTALGLIAQATRDEIIPEILPFIEAHIKHQNWKLREAATLAFGSILEGPKMVQALVAQALPILLEHMNDSQLQVKDTATWTFGRICQLHPKTLDDKLNLVFQVLVEKLNDSPGVAAHACWAICNLAEHFEHQADLATSPLSSYFEVVVKILLVATEREDASEKKLRISAYEAINSMVVSSAKDRHGMIVMLIPLLLQRLEKTFTMQVLNFDDKQEQNEKQSLLCGTLQIITQKLGEAIKPYADGMMTLFLQVFNFKTASVHEEALMAVGAIANAVDVEFEKYMPHFHRPLLAGLQNWEEYMVCSIAVAVVGDVCRALGERVLPYCNDIVTCLLQNLQNPNLHRNAKPPILSCFGDIALAIGGNFERYYGPVVTILAQASSTQVDPDDYDLVEYLNLLRDGIFEAFTGIIQGLRSDGKANLLEPQVEMILQFIEVVWKDPNTNDIVTKGLVGVIGDLAHALGSPVKALLQRKSVSEILISCSKHEDPQVKDVAKWANQIIQKL